MAKINSASSYVMNRSLVFDDFQKIFESQNCKEIAQNLNDLMLRLPNVVAYRINEIEKAKKL